MASMTRQNGSTLFVRGTISAPPLLRALLKFSRRFAPGTLIGGEARLFDQYQYSSMGLRYTTAAGVNNSSFVTYDQHGLPSAGYI